MLNSMFATLCLLLGQDPQLREVRELVDRLRSDKIEVRDEGWMKLKMLRSPALPSLERYINDPDHDIAARVKRLIRAISIAEQFPPELLTELHGIDGRLADEDNHVWTLVFLKATRGAKDGKLRYPDITGGLLADLLPQALDGTRTLTETIEICDNVACIFWKIRQAVQPLMRLLRSNESSIRAAAVRALGKLSDTTAETAVIPLLEDPNDTVRWEAVIALHAVGSAKSAPSLLALLRDNKAEIRAQAAIAISGIGVKSAIDPLLAMLIDDSPEVRSAAIYSLQRLGATETVKQLERLLEDREGSVRGAAASALGKLKAQGSESRLEPLLEDPDPYTQGLAALSLAELGATKCSLRIAKLLTTADARTRRMSISALEQLRARDQIEAIAHCLEDTDSSARGAAALALAHLEARDRIGAIVTLLSHDAGYGGDCAARALGSLEAMNAVPDILGILKEGDPEFRMNAVYALELLGAREAVSRLIDLVGAAELRYAIANALGYLGDKDSVPCLLTLLADADPEVRIASAEALGRLGSAGCASHLKPLLSDPRTRVRIAVAKTLCRIGAKEGIPFVLRAYGGSTAGTLLSLNAVRQPETWEKLRSLSIGRNPKGRAIFTMRDAADALKLGLNMPETSTQQERDWLPVPDIPFKAGCRGGCTSVVDGILDLLEDSPFEIILESDRIVLVRNDEAYSFWKAWWSSQESTK